MACHTLSLDTPIRAQLRLHQCRVEGQNPQDEHVAPLPARGSLGTGALRECDGASPRKPRTELGGATAPVSVRHTRPRVPWDWVHCTRGSFSTSAGGKTQEMQPEKALWTYT